MPYFSDYKNMYGGKTVGQMHKYESDYVMEETWWNDISSRVAYLYDWYHDDNKTQLNDLSPASDSKKIPIDIKYLVNSSQTYSKDFITYHLQMRPSQVCNVDYYDEFFGKRYFSDFPCGLYVDIEDSYGKYNRWLVVAKANSNDPQFQTFEILRCDYIAQWVMDGKKYNVASVLRSQNSYNSGVWTDDKFTVTEDQQKFIVPINRETEKLYYNQRMIIDAPVLSEPRAWVITKVNRLSANGLVNVTLAQDKYNQEMDYIELDDNGEVIGMWADYYSQPIQTNASSTSSITFSGLSAEIKVGGSYKKLTVSFTDEDGNDSDFKLGTWSYKIDDKDATDLLNILTNKTSIDVGENQVKIKFTGGDEYLGKELVVSYTTYDNITSTLTLDIVSL